MFDQWCLKSVKILADFLVGADITVTDCTVGTPNKEQVGKHRIVRYCESSFYEKLNFGKHQHSVIVSPFLIVTLVFI